MMDYIEIILNIAVDMGFYMMVGLLLVSIAHIFLRKEFIARHLGSDSLWSITKASLLGVPLPLCSCGVIPAGVYIKEKGGSDAAAVSFLVSTPQTGVDSIAATYGMMGLTFAWFRPVAAFVSGILSGIMVKIFGNRKETTAIADVDEETCSGDCCCSSECTDTKPENTGIPAKIFDSLKFTFGEFLSDISLHFLIGLLIAFLIMVLVPDDLVIRLGLQGGIVSMLAMIVIGLPMYICSTSSIPIALTLLVKGISPGAAFVFLFMGPFSNIASLIVLAKKFGKRTMALYLAGAIISALAFGFILDGISGILVFPDFSDAIGKDISGTGGILKMVTAAVFYIFVFKSVISKYLPVFSRKRQSS